MKSRIDRRAFLMTALGGALATPAIPSDRSFALGTADFGHVRSKIRKEVAAGSVASFAVAVASGGKVLWQEAFGWADVGRRIPATVRTRYSISSVSKPFTATAIMALVDRGLLAIDKPLGPHILGLGLKPYGGDPATITAKHLLQHTSGLPRHWRNLYTDERHAKLAFTETIRRYGIVTQAPGSGYIYSNLGYGLLARIVENISRKPFAKFMEQEVFLPLRLKDTTVENEPKLSRQAAALYNADGSRVPQYSVDEFGSQRVFSTVQDLIQFGLFHLKTVPSGQRKIIGKDAFGRMRDEKFPVDGQSLFSSLGWLVLEKGTHNHLQVVHSGDAPGVSAQLTLLPDKDIAVAVISNTRFAELIYTATDEILDTLIPENKAMRESQPAVKADGRESGPTQEMVGTWTGEIKTYSGSIPTSMTINKDGDIHFKLDGQLETQVNNLQIIGNRLSGRCSGMITTDDALSRPHHLRLALRREGRTLSGTVHAQASADAVAKGVPKRDYFALASWIQLTKR